MTRTARLRDCLIACLIGSAVASCAFDDRHGFGAADRLDPDAAQSPTALMGLAEYSEATGDLRSAATLYQRAHALDPGNREPLIRLVTLLNRIGPPNAAVEAYRDLVALEPANAEAQRRLGNALISAGRPQEAVDAYRSALALGDDSRARSGLAVALDMLGRHAEARDHYAAALAQSPGDLDIKSNLAVSLALSGNYELAVETARATAFDPRATARHRQNLALVLGLANRMTEAAEVARSDLDEAGVGRAIAYYEMLRNLPSSADRAVAIGSGPPPGSGGST